jgi:predicted tellurium resistance membrane protein TerC
MDLAVIFSPDGLASLATLTLLEIVLGIDNIVFITILTNRLPTSERARARSVGISLALVIRLGLLFALTWVMSLVEPLFGIAGHPFSGRDLILLGGGLFLIGKASSEIASKVELEHEPGAKGPVAPKFFGVLFQILLLDIVFSLDSVITAVGMANHVEVMAIAMVIAVGVMLLFAGPVGSFVERHPSMQILALSFLILIGAMLVVEGWGSHVEKGYIYFAMAFALLVDLVQLWVQKKHRAPVKLNTRLSTDDPGGSARSGTP